MLAALVLWTWAAPSRAAQDVVIGAIFPLGVPAGADARAAIETALDLVNGAHAPAPVLMGEGGGLKRLDGAKLRAEFADDADQPDKAAAEAERLIADAHVVALTGGSSEASASAIRAVAQKHELPYLATGAAAADAPDFPWCFTIGATPEMSAAALFGFLKDGIGRPVKTLALVYEDRPLGLRASDAQRKLADAAGLERVVQLNLKPGAPTLVAEAEQIAEKKPDAVIATLGAANAALLMRSLAERHADPVVLAQADGFAEGMFAGLGFVADLGGARPALVAVSAAFQARAGHALDPASAQILTAVLLLADVINRAGATKPDKLRIALMATDTPSDQLPMAWSGIRFNDGGQNVLATPVIAQVQAGAYRTVWPKELAAVPPILTPGK